MGRLALRLQVNEDAKAEIGELTTKIEKMIKHLSKARRLTAEIDKAFIRLAKMDFLETIEEDTINPDNNGITKHTFK